MRASINLLTTIFLFSILLMPPKVSGSDYEEIQEERFITFDSLSSLNSFFTDNKFYVYKFDGSGWSVELTLDKSKMYTKDKYYVIAPYFYVDREGVLKRIPQENVHIWIADIPENITIVITGFKEASVEVSNFGGTVKFGSYVNLGVMAGVNLNIGEMLFDPSNYFIIEQMKTLWDYYNSLKNIRGDTFFGLVDTRVLVYKTSNVFFDYYLSTNLPDPITVKDVETAGFFIVDVAVSINNKMDGTGIAILNAKKVVFNGSTAISRYHYNLYLRKIEKLNISGDLYVDGHLMDVNSEDVSRWGVGIYADDVDNVTVGTVKIKEVVDFESVFGNAMLMFKGWWNSSNNQFISETNVSVFLIIHNKSGRFYPFFLNLNRSYGDGIVNLSIINSTFHSDKLENQSIVIQNDISYLTNYTLGISFKDLRIISNYILDSENMTIGNKTYKRYLEILFIGARISKYSFLDGIVPREISLTGLQAGIGVPDDGSGERDLIDLTNTTAIKFGDTEQAIGYGMGYVNQEVSIDVAGTFSGFTSIIGVLVAIGWMRIGVQYMSANPEKIKAAKEQTWRAALGTVMVAMILFGWASMLGLFSWIFGGG